MGGWLWLYSVYFCVHMKPMSTIIKTNFCEQSKASLQPVQFQPEDRRIFHLTWGLGTWPLLWPTRQRLTLPPPSTLLPQLGKGATLKTNRAAKCGLGYVQERERGGKGLRWGIGGQGRKEKGLFPLYLQVTFNRFYDTSVFCCWTLEQVRAWLILISLNIPAPGGRLI